MNLIGLKIKETFSSHNKINYHILEGQEDLHLTLRGQPVEDSKFGVVRTYLYKGKWEISGPYIGDKIMCSREYDCIIEGSHNVKEINFLSNSKGLITIKIEGNNFVKCEFTQTLNTGRRYKLQDGDKDLAIKIPNDITDVYVK